MLGYNQTFETKWKGLIPSLMEAYHEKNYGTLSRWADEFMTVVPCSVCNGGRLNQEALSYQIGGVSIARRSCIPKTKKKKGILTVWLNIM